MDLVCMIAYRPASPTTRGSNIPNQVISTAMDRHPDGFGIAWREPDENGKPVLQSARFGPDDRKAFRAELKRIDRMDITDYVAHWRFATHGPEDMEHAHPFEYHDPIEGRVLVFHNGIVDIVTTVHESDTEVFVRDVLAHLPTAWWRNAALRFLVASSVGWSRLVLMTDTETVNLQEVDGEWDGGLWYSSNHKPSIVATTGGTYAYGGKTYAGAGDGDHDSMSHRPEFDSDEDWTTEESAWGMTRERIAGAEFLSQGHVLSVVLPFDRHQDGDYEDAVVCNECGTTGTAYVISGSVWFDISHRADDNDYDDDSIGAIDAALLRDEMADRALALLPNVH